MFESVKKRIKSKLGVPTVSDSLILARENGFTPKVIYDIGAYEGKWTQEVLAIFPYANFFMFEAQDSKEPFLKKISNIPSLKINYHIGLLGADKGKQVVFHEYETASSVHEEYFETEALHKIKYLETLDSVVEKCRWPQPDLIKLDTQGFELEILKGGVNALQSSELILMEVSLLELYKGAPLLEDVISQMAVWNFQVYDICSLMRRPLDKALYQTDLLFVSKNSQLIASKRWA